MKQGFLLFVFCPFLIAHVAEAVPRPQQEWTPPQTAVDVVGDIEGTTPAPAKAVADTIWIATWDFEGCDDSGWVRSDNRILNDGNIYWYVDDRFDGVANIAGAAAMVGAHNLCWDCGDGYDNNWYQGIRIDYSGDKLLVFDFLVDSEGGYDFLQVETDSACSSFGQVDYDIDPGDNGAAYRDLVWSATGFDTTTARSDTIPLSGYGTAGLHCLYIAFISDGAYSNLDFACEGIGVGAVVDNVELLQDNGGGSYTSILFEDFTGFVPGPGFDFVNMLDATPFGVWARVYNHITDNDVCTEDLSCAWLATDDTTPTLANDPSMAFGPGGFVFRNWKDEVTVGPWVSLASTPDALGTFVQLRRFPGNFFANSRAVQNWSIRGRTKVANTDTPAPGDSIDCISGWGHANQWNSLGLFRWVTTTWYATSNFDPSSQDIQLRLRESDWQWIAGAAPPDPYRPGPGPFWDRIRLGRRVLTGPEMDEGIDARYQAQDAAPNDPAHEAGPLYAQAAGGDIFGTTSFSRAGDLGLNATTANLIVGDSITCRVEDVLGHGGLNIEVYFSIVEGPHAGQAPAPYSVQPNGFFPVTAENCRLSNGTIISDLFFVDLDDTYFRGGDVLHYFWWATDAQGGASSTPAGLTSLPPSVESAEITTGGLFEVSFLPRINWDQGYVGRIQADPNGDLDPTPTELANSSQANCILYYENINSRRRSGDLNRTSFMYTLDKLGYRGLYDVYDHTGLGNTNNHLGSRMSPEQARNYSLLVYDAGTRGPGAPILPDGIDLDAAKIDMEQWFQDWNALSGTPNAEHTLWILAENAMQERPSSPLYTNDMAASFGAANQGQDNNPDVFGVANFVTHTACLQTHVGEQFALNGGCPAIRDYDDIAASGTGVLTHVYGKGSPGSAGATVMNANAGGFTTILSSFAWFDIRSSIGQVPVMADEDLLSKVLACALPLGCQQSPNPTDTDGSDVIATPAHTALHQNTPNPFNPVTTIHFDLAHEGPVSMRIYDVAGRLVRTLVEQTMPAGFDQQATWNGLDDAGRRVSSGVYFYRLVAGDVTATRKMVVMK